MGLFGCCVWALHVLRIPHGDCVLFGGSCFRRFGVGRVGRVGGVPYSSILDGVGDGGSGAWLRYLFSQHYRIKS